MKRWLGLFFIFILLFSLAGCRSLPDPQEALEAEFTRIKSGEDSAMLDSLSATFNLQMQADESEAVREALHPAMTALLSRTQFTITDKQVDQKAGTAVLSVDVEVPDMEQTLAVFEELGYQRAMQLYAEKSQDVTDEDLYVAILGVFSTAVTDPSVGTKTRALTLNMTYDKSAKQWIVDNPEVFESIYQ